MKKESQTEWMSRAKVTRVDRDQMPRQVAVEMLARPGVKLSSRDRRAFMKALETVFVSELQKKPREEKLTFKLQHSSWAQINKWLKRSTKRYYKAQEAYSKAAEKVASFEEGSKHRILGERMLSEQQVILGLMQSDLDQLETEVEARGTTAVPKLTLEDRAKAFAADRISTADVTL